MNTFATFSVLILLKHQVLLIIWEPKVSNYQTIPPVKTNSTLIFFAIVTVLTVLKHQVLLPLWPAWGSSQVDSLITWAGKHDLESFFDQLRNCCLRNTILPLLQVLMKDISTPVPPNEVWSVIKTSLEKAALVNYERLSEEARIEAEQANPQGGISTWNS